MRRGDIHWAVLPAPVGRRPVVIVTRTRALGFLRRVTVAPITTTIRGIASEVPLGRAEGLPRKSVAGCDSLMTIDRGAIDPDPIGHIDRAGAGRLDAALRFALGIGG